MAPMRGQPLKPFNVKVFGHKVQVMATTRYQAKKWEAKENSCMPFRHIYDVCPYMKALLDNPEEIDRDLYVAHDCKDHE
jgi:hypothetical protein